MTEVMSRCCRRHAEHRCYSLLSRGADSSMQSDSYLVISITGGHHLDIVQTRMLTSGRLIWMFTSVLTQLGQIHGPLAAITVNSNSHSRCQNVIVIGFGGTGTCRRRKQMDHSWFTGVANGENCQSHVHICLSLKLTLTLIVALKIKIMYAVQNDTELKFNRVLYIQVIFLGTGLDL